jgi:hypothetical protein
MRIGLGLGLDPAKLIGGSSYAEIANAGVTEGSVAAISLPRAAGSRSRRAAP